MALAAHSRVGASKDGFCDDDGSGGVDFSAGAEEVQILQVEGGIDGSKLVKSVL